ncbi:16S rRNA (guanine(966)-N(2))-methyltransferase [hydrothermal vent metagenome]|uniref:16S rRNA (Guanine(966)-N(2))-methyltransferase n=1 Tax=hydrothermal vent metagenome TaxID=652676 RepID=A0A3B1E1B5_9ZZZZ
MLRIIGGELKRRRLHTPPDAETTRPMPDRVRLSLFNLLRGHFEGVEVFDGFAGTGAIGFEALSRGASGVVFVERERKIAALIERSAEELGVADRCEIAASDALGAGALARCPEGVHLVFFDPPYPLVQDPAQWPRVREQFSRLIGKLDETGYAVLRTPWPFLHVEGGGEAEEATPEHRPDRCKGRSRGHRRGREPVVEVEVVDLETPAVKPKMLPVDLAIPGALGPETHEYGSMAVHLYMKDAGGSSAV